MDYSFSLADVPPLPPPAAASPHPERSALRFVGLDGAWEHWPVYDGQVAKLRALLICEAPYVRPQEKQRGSAGAMGSFLSFKEARAVREEEDMEEHIRGACGACFPHASARGNYVPGADLVAAACSSVRLGKKAKRWRARRVGILRDVAAKLRPLSAAIRACVPSPPTVRAVAGGLHTALIFALCDALLWPDVQLPYRLLTGMPVLGVIEDTGLYRPVTHDETVDEFRVRFDSFLGTNDAWLAEVCEMMEGRARRRSTADSWAAAELERVTEKEITAGFLGEPMTLAELRERRGSSARPLPRHAGRKARRPYARSTMARSLAATRRRACPRRSRRRRSSCPRTWPPSSPSIARTPGGACPRSRWASTTSSRPTGACRRASPSTPPSPSGRAGASRCSSRRSLATRSASWRAW